MAARGDTEVMRMDLISLVLVTLVAVTGCRNPSGFTTDAGFADEDPSNISPDEIGKPCVYNPARPNEVPTNDCAGGLTCAIVTRDVKEAILNDEVPTTGFNTMGLILPLHEDHLTVHNDNGTDTGYCTVLGTIAAPQRCPLGTVRKGFSSTVAGGFMLACLKPCSVSAECENGGVCDARFFDDDTGDGSRSGTIGFCVRPCEVDYPDCMRTGAVRFNPADENAFATQLAAVDLFGSRTCNQVSGLCEVTGARSIGNDGDACDDTRDCVNGALCLQTDARGLPLDRGFCARRCFVGQSTGQEGTCGTELCQPALTFGYTELPVFDPTNLYRDAPIAADGSSTRLLNGLCFDGCVDGFGCDADRPGVSCGAVDAAECGAAWNEQSMCLPPGILLQTDGV